jgi:hypothetical protein
MALVTIDANQLAQVISQAIMQLSNPNQQQQQGVNPQGIFDSIGNFLGGAGKQVIQSAGRDLVKQAENWLGDMLTSLGNDPYFQQQVRSALASGQVAGVNPQSIFGDAWGWFKQHIPEIAEKAAPTVIEHLPDIFAALANQPRQPGQLLGTQGARPYLYNS